MNTLKCQRKVIRDLLSDLLNLNGPLCARFNESCDIIPGRIYCTKWQCVQFIERKKYIQAIFSKKFE